MEFKEIDEKIKEKGQGLIDFLNKKVVLSLEKEDIDKFVQIFDEDMDMLCRRKKINDQEFEDGYKELVNDLHTQLISMIVLKDGPAALTEEEAKLLYKLINDRGDYICLQRAIDVEEWNF